MYEEINPIHLVCYADKMNNNLSISENGMVSVARSGNVNVIPIDENSVRRSKFISCAGHGVFPREFVTQTGWMELMDEDYLVILSTLGLQIYDPDGCSVVFSHKCKDTSKEGYARGLYFYKNYLCVGNNTGHIRVFQFINISNKQISLRSSRSVHDSPILWISGSDEIVASSAANKTIAVHDTSQGKLKTLHFLLPSSKCLSLIINQDVMYAASGTGIIYLYDFFNIKTTKNAPMLLTEIKAHKSEITGMSYAADILLTASSDGCIKIWKSQKTNTRLENIFELKIKEGICGASFASKLAKHFFIAVPESTEVKVFRFNGVNRSTHITI